MVKRCKIIIMVLKRTKMRIINFYFTLFNDSFVYVGCVAQREGKIAVDNG